MTDLTVAPVAQVDVAEDERAAPAAEGARDVRSAPRAGHRDRWRVGLVPVMAIGVLVLWHLGATLVFTDGHTLPEPLDVVRALGEHRDIWWPNAKATMIPALKGLAIGMVIAIVLAGLTLLVPITERPVMRVAVAVHSLPVIAIGPILQVSLAGNAPATALAALSVVFVVMVSLIGGLRAVPPNSADIARGLGARPWTYFTKVRVPSALPSFFSGLRVAFPSAVIGSLIGEFMGAPRGLGVAMIGFVSELETASTWATGVVITAITTAGFVVIGVVAKRVTRFIPAVATPPAVVVPQRRLARVAASLMTFAVSAGTLLLGWVGYLKLFDINSFVGKGPGDVWRFLSEPMFSDSRHEVMSALNQTLVDAGIGLVMGWTVAIALACSFVLWPTVERTLMPLALALRSVPILAVLPALTLTFGRGLTGTVVIVMIIVFFPTLVIVLQALRSVPPDLVAVARAYNSSALTLLRKVRLPLALPAVFASLRIACPGALLGALLAEWLATGKGMGYLMLSATTLSEYTTLWAASVVLTSIAVIAYTVTDALERFVIVRFGAAPNA